MPERPFTCKTSATIYDVGLNSVSLLAEVLFTRLDQCSDRFGRFSADPMVVMGECLAMRMRQLTLEEVTKALGELAAAGCIKFCERGGRRWIQVADHLRYHQNAVHKPRWGDTEELPQQAELPMLCETNLPGEPSSFASSDNKMREEKTNNKSNKNNDSGALKPLPSPENVNNSETRAVSADGESRKAPEGPRLVLNLPPDKEPTPKKKGRLRKDRSAEEEILLRVGKLAGDKERIENGGIWITRFREHPVAVNEALAQLQLRLLNAREAAVKNRGAWLTDKFMEFSGQARKRA